MKNLSDVRSVNDFLKFVKQPKKTSWRQYSAVIRQVTDTLVSIYPPHVLQEIAIRLIHFLEKCHGTAATTLEKERMMDDADFYREQERLLNQARHKLDDVCI